MLSRVITNNCICFLTLTTGSTSLVSFSMRKIILIVMEVWFHNYEKLRNVLRPKSTFKLVTSTGCEDLTDVVQFVKEIIKTSIERDLPKYFSSCNIFMLKPNIFEINKFKNKIWYSNKNMRVPLGRHSIITLNIVFFV